MSKNDRRRLWALALYSDRGKVLFCHLCIFMCRILLLYFRFAKTNDDPDMAGGVFAVRTDHFREINGYSNSFWGWGHEDVDIAWR